MDINLESLNGTGLAELHYALNQARLVAGSANFHAFTKMIEMVETAGDANCGVDGFTAELQVVKDRREQ